MIDPAIIEAAARRLAKLTGSPDHEFLRGFVSAVLAEATPLIEAAALERIEELEAALRAIKKLGHTRGYGREALAQIAARALKQEAGE